jgi:hypothetical protein
MPLTGSNAQSLPANWQSDCVGRMQLSLPEAADIATVTPDSILKSDSTGHSAKAYFADGQTGWYSSVGYFGPVNATGPLSEQEIATLRKRLERETLQVKSHQKSRKRKDAKAKFAVLPTPGWDGVAWDFGSAIYGRLFGAGQYYAWEVSTEPQHRDFLEARFKTLIAGLAPRKNFTLPAVAGVCHPHFFVRDAGKEYRNVATSYRLRSHPDVTLVLQDTNAVGIETFQNPDRFTARSKTNFFWTQRYQSPISRETLSNDAISFAGQKGLEIRLKLGREDGSEDYGYSVFTRGDPDAKQDTPDLMLILIRNAADAKAKGRTPISEEAFFALAKTVAASVKVRPVVR